MSNHASIVDDIMQRGSDEDGETGRKTALVTGSVALGAVVTSSLFRKLRHLQLIKPQDLAPAVDAPTNEMEIMEGRARFYEHEGTGVPVVLLHGINAAASSFEMKPVFEHVASHSTRPVFALDWLGFGRSDRSPVRYSPSLYQRQLRRFLSEHVHQPADVIALSAACEYTAEIARTLPYLVHRLVFISPTGLSYRETPRTWRRAVVSMADSVGAFEIFYYRLTRPEVMRRFFERQIFLRPDVPLELVEYARATTLVRGAHHAPRYFIQGSLSDEAASRKAYEQLRVPTLMLVPESSEQLIQRFDALGDVVNVNPEYVRVQRLPSGLMPQWEAAPHLFEAIDRFLSLS